LQVLEDVSSCICSCLVTSRARSAANLLPAFGVSEACYKSDPGRSLDQSFNVRSSPRRALPLQLCHAFLPGLVKSPTAVYVVTWCALTNIMTALQILAQLDECKNIPDFNNYLAFILSQGNTLPVEVALRFYYHHPVLDCIATTSSPWCPFDTLLFARCGKAQACC